MNMQQHPVYPNVIVTKKVRIINQKRVKTWQDDDWWVVNLTNTAVCSHKKGLQAIAPKKDTDKKR